MIQTIVQGLKTVAEEDRVAYEGLLAQLLEAYPGHLPLLQERLTRRAAAKPEVRQEAIKQGSGHAGMDKQLRFTVCTTQHVR